MRNHSCCDRLAFPVTSLSGPKRSRRGSTTPASVSNLPPRHRESRSPSRRTDFSPGSWYLIPLTTKSGIGIAILTRKPYFQVEPQERLTLLLFQDKEGP